MTILFMLAAALAGIFAQDRWDIAFRLRMAWRWFRMR